MPNNVSNQPIGVFDSGLGGLTVVKELMRHCPNEHLVYFGDTARVPYGTKSKEAIIRFSIENAKVLLSRKVKLIVVACNSSSSYALDTLQKRFLCPVVGVIFPGAKKASDVTRNNRVGVVATQATVESGRYEQALKRCSKKVKTFAQSCPLFVPLAEEGMTSGPVVEAIASSYVKTLKTKKVDTLILGCTHYPLLKKVLKKVMGPKVTLVDSASEVAQEVKKTLKHNNLRRVGQSRVNYTYLISDRPQAFEKQAKKFLGRSVAMKVEQVHV